ncbi:MAG: class I peptide chain release factor [Coxiella sp. (in: Bacteria)]|nr:MAG: class I peptide chain release factor [Coxiella sp. (in: g-proteobacteria)]
MLKVSHNIIIPDTDLKCQYSRSSGPGGQNVNKVETRVQLFFDVTSSALPEPVRQRFCKMYANQISKEQKLVLVSQCFRSQERNRHAALKRLKHYIEQALKAPKHRKKKKPSKAMREKRLRDKKYKSSIKGLRRKPD